MLPFRGNLIPVEEASALKKKKKKNRGHVARDIRAGGSKDRRETTPISGGASGILTDKGTLLPVNDLRKLDDQLFMQITD